MTRKSIDYSGKKVNVGIDVHKKTYSVYCTCEGQMVKRATVVAEPERLGEFLNYHFAGADIYSAYEAGFSGFDLHRVLVGLGIKNIVVNPSSIEVAAKDRVKTDKRDCKKVAIQLEAGRLEGIFVPTVEQEGERLLTRTREQLVNERTRVGNQFKNRLYQFGLIGYEDDTKISERFIDANLSGNLPNRLRECLSVLARLWKFVNEEIRQLEKQMKEQAKHDKNDAIYRSIPGIGPTFSRILSNELGDMSQFRNERALFSHTGLTPSEFSTGGKDRKGHITRQGSSRIRSLLTEAAWTAIKEDPKLRESFNRIALRRGKKRAIVAIARKMIGRVRCCLRKRVTYELGYSLAA